MRNGEKKQRNNVGNACEMEKKSREITWEMHAKWRKKQRNNVGNEEKNLYFIHSSQFN
jgi:hypothetical protein